MNTTAITFFVAAALAADVFAQNPTQKDARAELSAAIAVEEQQGDLAAAERLYRELLNSSALSVPARALANQRLGSLLQRLGRADDAKPFLEAAQRASNIEITPAMPQDRAREAELGEQAKKLLADRSKEIDEQTRKELLWIGQPAVPAILAELEAHMAGPDTNAERPRALASLLWRIGGEKAENFLRMVSTRRDAPWWIVSCAVWLDSDAMLAVAREFLGHPNFQLVELMLTSGSSQSLANRMPADAILTMAERGGDEQRDYALRWCAQRSLSTSESTRLAAIAASAALSTNPSLGSSASVAIPHLQGSVAGLRLVFDQLPGQKRALAIVEPPEDLYVAGSKKFEPQIAADLWQRAMRSASALTEKHDAWAWLNTWIERLAEARLPGQFEDLLVLQKRRSEAWQTIAKVVDAEHAVAAIQQVPDLNSDQGSWLLQGIARLDLPKEAGALLLSRTSQDRSELLANRDRAWWFCLALASTGHPDAMPLLRDAFKSLNFDVRILTFAIHRSRSDAALAMAHEVFAELKQQSVQGSIELLLAMLALGDEWALAQIDGSEQTQPHPYLDGPDGGLRRMLFLDRGGQENSQREPRTPLQYLLTTTPQPPHPFTLAQIEPVLKRVFADGQRHIASSLVGSLPDASDDVVRLLARYDRSTLKTGERTYESWIKVAMQRMREQGGKNGWTEWLESALADERQRYYVLNELTKDEVRARLTQIEAFAKDGSSVQVALDALLRAGHVVDVVALLTSDNVDAKHWAFDRVCKGEATAPAAKMLPFLTAKSTHTRLQAVQHFDRTLEAEAVPGLLALLRDPDGKIREAASAALQRIRFAHEQESLWARAQNGIDARPEAALEKLLAQAKPTESKPKRLLAIASLGALGKPEALPFLIEWTEDQDTEIANAARAAATQIHLDSKR